ncbi:hypothetical protein KW508_03650 [Vibrio fluvialis]|nr:hypothetical protein [Vibrio fluvialis]
MSMVNIRLNADTSQYVQRIRNAKTETDRNIIRMEQRVDKFATDVSKNLGSINDASNMLMNGLRGAKFGGYIAAVGAVGYAAVSAANQIKQIGTAAMHTSQELNLAATRSRTSVQEIATLGAVTSTVGISMEKLGDISKDVFDRIGDYATMGTGPLQDFFDVVGDKSGVTVEQLQRMSGPEVLGTLVSEMEKAGASGSQITFVMESIASDASNLTPLLRNNSAALKELSSQFDTTRAVISKGTAESVAVVNNSFEVMTDNFQAYITEASSGMLEMGGTVADYFAELFADRTEAIQRVKIERSIETKDKPNADTLTGNALTDRLRILKEYSSAEQAAARQSEIDQRHLTLSRTMAGKKYADQQKAVWEANQAARDKDVQNEIKALEAKANYEKRASESTAALGNKATGGATAQTKDQTLSLELSAQAKQYQNLETLAKEHADRIAAINERMRTETNAQAKQYLEQELKLEQSGLDRINENMRVSLEEKRRIESEKTQIQRAGSAERLQVAVQYATDETSKLSAQYNLDLHNLETALQKGVVTREMFNTTKANMETTLQTQLRNIEVNAQREKLGILASLASTDTERRQVEYDTRLQQLQVWLETDKITEEQFAAGKGEAEYTRMQAESARKFEAIQNDAEREFYIAQEQQTQLNALREQGLVTEEQFKRRELETSKRYAEAERQLAQQAWSIADESLNKIVQGTEEGTAAHKAAVVAQQAATIANLSLGMWDAWAAVDRDPTQLTMQQKAISKGLVMAQYGAGIASAAAVTMGQFHSGTDEVDSTGSYILKAGERVVQPSANKDLTNYLADNKSGSGETVVNADLVVQGNASGINDAEMQRWMMQHRDMVTQAVKLAQREKPSLR